MIKKFTLSILFALIANINYAQNTFNFTNTAGITIVDDAIANPYPSSITVANLNGTITNVTLKINGFTHTSPGDVSIVLESPTGDKFQLLSNVFGYNPTTVSNLNFTLSDNGTAYLPDASVPANNGTFKPSSYFTGDNFPAPGPGIAGNYTTSGPTGAATFASNFNGKMPNGVWKLWVGDFLAGDDGSIASWELNITTTLSPLGLFNVKQFNAMCRNNTIAMNWNIDAQQAIDKIEIEGRNEHSSFQTLKTLNYNHENKISTSTTFDANGNNIFRLKVSNLAEQEDYSKTISTVCNTSTSNILVYPNPTNDYIYISNDINASKIEIYNSFGQQITQIVNPSTLAYISTKLFANGVYMLKIYSDDGIKNYPFSKF